VAKVIHSKESIYHCQRPQKKHFYGFESFEFIKASNSQNKFKCKLTFDFITVTVPEIPVFKEFFINHSLSKLRIGWVLAVPKQVYIILIICLKMLEFQF
jgi:4'-phosphopantetheinyl transferase EntD